MMFRMEIIIAIIIAIINIINLFRKACQLDNIDNKCYFTILTYIY